MSDVYSFGVVLLELLTGRRSVDKSRPHREQNLVEWARPMLSDTRKLCRIMDPRLEGQYSESGARKAAALAYQCLSQRPKNRPTMRTVVKTLEPLKDFDDIPSGPFVYTIPAENDALHKDNHKESSKVQKESKKDNPHKKENGQKAPHHHHEQQLHHGHLRHQLKSPKSLKYYHTDTALRRNCRNGMHTPVLHQMHVGRAA